MDNLKGKDLITVGIFACIYFVLSLFCNILGGLHAIVWFLSPAITAIVCAIPFLIFATKIKKAFSLFLYGIIVGFLFFITGQFHILVPIFFIITSLIMEVIRKIGGYNSFNVNSICFSIFSLSMIASPLPLWLDSESFISQIEEFGMSQSYILIVKSLTSVSMLIVVILSTIVCSIIGILIARYFFDKHFNKAGVL